MLHPCVLPSNASPLVAATESTTRVLQEHSGNRQHSDLKYTQNYKELSSSENTHPRQLIRATHQLYRPQPASHAPFRTGFARPSYARSHHPTQAEKDDRARRLLRRFHSSEQYAKYRAKGSKDDKSEEKKWPDHLEQAFFRGKSLNSLFQTKCLTDAAPLALVEYPPMGRKKLLFKDKQRGRNELITDWILMATGLKRNRKQVSSHIQVLKPFVQDDPIIMAYLSAGVNADHVSPQKFMPAYYSQQLHGRGPSSYPVQAPPQSIRHQGARQIHSLPTLRSVGGQGKLRDTPDVFEPVDFEMFVQRKLGPAESSHDEVERLHTYTKQISQPWEADEFFSDWNDFARVHPSLSAMHAHRPVDCNVIAAQASLALHSGPWKDKDGLPVRSDGIELGISFHCRTGELPRPFEVICQNHFYERGKLIENSTHAHAILDGTSNNDIQVMFGSNFWVKALSAKHREACDSGPEGGSAFISSINATQDIFIKTATGTERVMIIHWSFRQSTGGLGRTSWKRVVMPPSTTSSQYASPSKVIPADTTFNFNDDPLPNFTASGAPSQPALQSPFEYNSGTGPEPTAAIWPTPISDANGLALIHASSSTDVDMTNAFDFTGGHMDIAYDPDLNLDNFDTSAFNFDATTDDFAADPVLQDYSQSWMDGGYTNSFDSGPQSFAEDSFQASAAIESQSSSVFPSYGVFDPQMYGVEQESQAFGGAGQDVVKEAAAMPTVTEFATQADIDIDINIESQDSVQ
jgi:hypothetical protein